jgi:hypothetical protein
VSRARAIKLSSQPFQLSSQPLSLSTQPLDYYQKPLDYYQRPLDCYQSLSTANYRLSATHIDDSTKLSAFSDRLQQPLSYYKATTTHPIRPTYPKRQRVKPLPSPSCATSYKEREESLQRCRTSSQYTGCSRVGRSKGSWAAARTASAEFESKDHGITTVPAATGLRPSPVDGVVGRLPDDRSPLLRGRCRQTDVRN